MNRAFSALVERVLLGMLPEDHKTSEIEPLGSFRWSANLLQWLELGLELVVVTFIAVLGAITQLARIPRGHSTLQ